MLAYFKPQGKLGGSNLLTDRATNQLYVILSGQLHPVYNLTSARLVLGNPANPATVKSSELSKLPLGQTIGIPGAPYATPVSGDTSSTWTLCDTVSRADTASPAVQTSVIAMPLTIDSSIDPVKANEAMLAYLPGPNVDHHRQGPALDRPERPGPHLGDGHTRHRQAGPRFPRACSTHCPSQGAWQLPPIPDAGAPNTLGLPDDLVIGSVFQIHTDKGPQYYVVLPDGIAQVNATTAAALRATQSHGLVAPPAVVPSAGRQNPRTGLRLTAARRTAQDRVPARRTHAVLECGNARAGDQAPKTTVLSGRHLPIPAVAMSTGIKQIQGTATVYIDGGKFVQLQSPDPRYGESMYYVDPEGVRYGVPNADSAKALGLSSPKTAPWEIVRLLVDGPVLSKDAALLEHETLPADPSPRKVPAGNPRSPLMTTKKFTPTITRGPRLTPGEISLTPPDDLGIDIPPSGVQKALPYVMGGVHARHDRDHVRRRHQAVVAVHADDAADDGHDDGRRHGRRHRRRRQEGARDQCRPQGVPALSGRTARPGDVLGQLSGGVLQLPRTASRRSAVDRRYPAAVVPAGQQRLLRGHPHRDRRPAGGGPVVEAGRRRRTGGGHRSTAAVPGAGQPHVGGQVPAHPRADP